MNRHTVSHGDQHGPGWDRQGGAITQNQGLASFVQERGVVHELTGPKSRSPGSPRGEQRDSCLSGAELEKGSIHIQLGSWPQLHTNMN